MVLQFVLPSSECHVFLRFTGTTYVLDITSPTVLAVFVAGIVFMVGFCVLIFLVIRLKWKHTTTSQPGPRSNIALLQSNRPNDSMRQTTSVYMQPDRIGEINRTPETRATLPNEITVYTGLCDDIQREDVHEYSFLDEDQVVVASTSNIQPSSIVVPVSPNEYQCLQRSGLAAGTYSSLQTKADDTPRESSIIDDADYSEVHEYAYLDDVAIAATEESRDRNDASNEYKRVDEAEHSVLPVSQTTTTKQCSLQ